MSEIIRPPLRCIRTISTLCSKFWCRRLQQIGDRYGEFLSARFGEPRLFRCRRRIKEGSNVTISAFLWLICCAVVVGPVAKADDQQLRKLLTSRGVSAALVVRDLSAPGAPREVVNVNGETLLKPASVLKVVTSAAALSELGPEYRFLTEVYAERRAGSSAESIALRGHGDPVLTTEAVWLLARRIRTEGILSIGEILLDDSLFATSRDPSGQRAYQSGSSALAFNFNSVGFRVCAQEPGSAAIVTADPWEANVTVENRIKTVRAGQWSFAIDKSASAAGTISFLARGSIAATVDCKTIYRSVDDPLAYLGSFLVATLRSLGVKVGKGWRRAPTPGRAELLFENYSKPLHGIVEDLNHFSTNFIGEQILYVLGDRGGGPGRYDHQQGSALLEKYLRSLGVPADQFTIVDGSGLDHDNRISARAIVAVLARLHDSFRMSPEFESSLSVLRRSGTLEKRDLGIPDELLRGKTGTLNGVSSLAGLLQNAQGKKLAFALIENGVPSKEYAEELERKVVSALYNMRL